MGDDNETGPPTPGRRAPWERPISRVPRPPSPGPGSPPNQPPSPNRQSPNQGPPNQGPPNQQPPNPGPPPSDPAPAQSDEPRSDRPQPDVHRRLSVAELLDKVSRMSPTGRSAADEPTPPPADVPRRVDHPAAVLPPSKPEPTPPRSEPPRPEPPRPEPPRPEPPRPEAPRPEPEAVGPVPPPALTRLALNRARKRKRLRLAGRATVSIVSVLALVVTGIVWGYLRSTDRGFAQVAALDTESTDVVDAPGQYGDETYLIVGTDTRAGASGQVGAGTVADAEGARSDTIMLVNIPADRSRVVAVSFPRDLDVERPECEGWDSTTGDYDGEMYPEAEGDKLNATYALGGPKCLVKTIQKISGLRISHFVGIDFAGFESMVNEVGGVQVCTSIPLEDAELGTILATTGEQTIDGHTALNYVRARNVEAEGNGDYGRITRQQRFLSSLLRSVLSNRVLFDPGKLSGFVTAFTQNTFVENVKTADLLTLGKSLRNVEAGAVTFLTVPTAGTTYYGNEIPRMDDIRAIFRAVIDDQPLPGEERAAAATTTPETPVVPSAPQAAVDPSLVSVQISNGSEVSGLASSTGDELANYGFQVVGTGNADTPGLAQTVVRYAPGQIADASTVASTIDGAVLEETTSLGGVVEVVLGTDFTGVVSAPTPLGETLPTFATGASGAPTDVALPTDLAVTNAADDSCA